MKGQGFPAEMATEYAMCPGSAEAPVATSSQSPGPLGASPPSQEDGGYPISAQLAVELGLDVNSSAADQLERVNAELAALREQQDEVGHELATAASTAHEELNTRMGQQPPTGEPIPNDLPSIVEELLHVQVLRQYITTLQVSCVWVGLMVLAAAVAA